MTRIIKWTDEVIQFMIENYEGKDNIELANLLNEKFNLNTNNDRVSNVKANLKRRKGIDLTTNINRGKYRLGVSPANKGKKWDEYMSKEGQEKSRLTTFKKGNIPKNHKPIGYERVNVDGYVEIKVAEPNVFKLKHRVIYENIYGKIPDNHNVVFADGNKLNLDPDNLILVSKSEMLIMNNNKLFMNERELTKTGSIIAKVIDKTNKIKNDRL